MSAAVGGRLAGKVGIVTGAGTAGAGIGNGRAIAILLARAGARLLLVDRERAAAEETRKLAREEGLPEASLAVSEADVSDPEHCRRVVQEALASWGRLDVLVNNVGVLGPSATAVEIDPVEWDRVLRVNVTSVLLMVKHAVPAMIAGDGGAIVNVSSIAGLAGAGPYLAYGASKAAVVSLTRTMAQQHGAAGIRVNCVAPGLIYTPMADAMFEGGMPPEQRLARRRRSLLQTEGTAWDVAAAVLFLVGDDARWITGVVMPVDGGSTVGDPMPAGGGARG